MSKRRTNVSGNRSDPTVHALAVLGARVLRGIAAHDFNYADEDELIEVAVSLQLGGPTDRHFDYATDAVRATVARLTATEADHA